MLAAASGPRAYLAPILFGFLVSLSQPATPEERQPLPSASAVVGRVELDRGRFLFVSGVGPAENVVVYLEHSQLKPPPPLPGPLKVLQRFKRFEPHVLVVTPGTIVDFPNLDPIFHNVFSSYYGEKFDLGLYKPGDSKRVEFKGPAVSWIFTRQLPLIRLSAKGFVRIPHKNKFGKDYPSPGMDPRYQDMQP